jgi:hypothetical protein
MSSWPLSAGACRQAVHTGVLQLLAPFRVCYSVCLLTRGAYVSDQTLASRRMLNVLARLRQVKPLQQVPAGKRCTLLSLTCASSA